MSFLKNEQVESINSFMSNDEKELRRNYRIKNTSSIFKTISKSELDSFLNEGWEIDKELKTKVKLKREKGIQEQLCDDIWCQLYKLGYRYLNIAKNVKIPYEKNTPSETEFDIVATNSDTILIVTCHTSRKSRELVPSDVNLRNLNYKLDGVRKALCQLFGKDKKIKFIFATRNIRLPEHTEEFRWLERTRSVHYNDNTYKYVNQLIEKYKSVALYQFVGLIFKHEKINDNKVEIPAVKGRMGQKIYYMFSIEPSMLLKMGFVLHRTRANESEFPTYQRLLVPSRLKGITKFIDQGGYFPNSIIVNFNTKIQKIDFKPNSTKNSDSMSCSGNLILPNAYGIAYIIDGQHRLYGYAGSKYLDNNTIPVVAFDDLDTLEQLEMFMDINQNQKAVSPSLRLDLEEDLFWNAERADSRLKALRSAIIKELTNSENSPLKNKISVGEDKEVLTFKPFSNAIAKSGLLPTAKRNAYDAYEESSLVGSLYDVKNSHHNQEMNNTKKNITEFLSLCYVLVEKSYPAIFNKEKYFIVSNRGAFAFICLIGDLNKFETQKGNLDLSSSPQKRFNVIKKYLITLLDARQSISPTEEQEQLNLLGQGADIKWLRFFQTKINAQHKDYTPPEFIDWCERQDEELQGKGRAYGIEIEKYIKEKVLSNLKTLFDDNWELEIGNIRRECIKRAEEERERKYKEDGKNEKIAWTEMFNINDYKSIIEKFFTKRPEHERNKNFKTFEALFSIDIGEGFNSKKDKLKWISRFNSYRNRWAHEGTKEKRLNKEEVEFLEKIHQFFIPN